MTRNERKAEELHGRTYYLAGPMTGYPQNNIPAFDEACVFLREQLKLTVVSPAELDDPVTRAEAFAGDGTATVCNGQTWGDFLARDLKIVADNVSGMILLQSWEKSKGARLEAYCAVLKGHTFYLYPSMERVSASYIISRL